MSYQLRCNRTTQLTDLWRTTAAGASEGPARGLNNTCVGSQRPGAQPSDCAPGPQGDAWYGGYEDALLEEHVLETIREHDAAAAPLFLFWAPHVAHAPLQAPQAFIDRLGFIAPTDQRGHQRQVYHAMVAFADAAVANVTAALKAKPGMWENTLVVFSSDNGGWISKNGTAGGNNWPLTGGKYNNWEGGIRMNAFASGGFVPAARRGTKHEGLVAVWDWYSTFAALAGVDRTDHRAAAAGLPPVDGFDLTGILTGSNLTSPRAELPIGTEPAVSNLSSAPLCTSYSDSPRYDDSAAYAAAPALGAPTGARCSTLSGIIVDEGGGKPLWKLLMGDEKQYVKTGPHYPNITTNFDSQAPAYTGHCGGGCLFDLRADPFENNDLAAAHPRKVAELFAKVDAYARSAFNPHRGKVDPAACETGLTVHGGFWGPWIE